MGNVTGTIWIRPILALISTITISYGVIVQVNIPNWYIVLTASIISFYFGHVNGRAEVATTQAGEIASTVLKRQINQQRITDPENSANPKVSEGAV